MKSIKNFIYLDDYKMYSISSQIFEGMTDYIIKGLSERTEEKDEQKGNFATGRIMADIAEKQSKHTEKIFLHDYSYTLFESKLFESNKVLEINETNAKNLISNLTNYSFIKVTGRIILNDSSTIENAIATFNELGINTTIVTNGTDAAEEVSKLSLQTQNIKDRNQKAKAEMVLKNKIPNTIKNAAKEKGLHLDETYLNSLKYLLNYGYQQQFEIQLPIVIDTETNFFSAILKRDSFKEDEKILLKKYSRMTEKEFTIFGIITQTKDNNVESITDSVYQNNTENMKSLITNFANKIANLQNVFVGRLPNEYVIDPIAIYQEL